MPALPKLVRRLLIGPLVVAIELLVIAASPLLLLLAALLSPVFGGLRPVRMAVIVISLLAHHLAAMAACLRLWVARPGPVGSDPEPVRNDYYAVLRGLIEGSYRTIVRATRVQVRLCDSDAAEEILRAAGPVVVLSRHAGEGDTLLTAHDLLSRYERRPRVVMHKLLRLDPVIDVLGSRLPNRFIDPRGGDIEHEIAELARDMGERDALLIFPEGGNSTAARRRRGVQRLEQAGHHQEAGWARSMRYLSAPRPGGALAAIHAAPDPVVIFVAHAGFPCSFGDVWRMLPRRQTVEVRMWAVPAHEVPVDRDAAIGWLFAWWTTLDDWVAERYDAKRG